MKPSGRLLRFLRSTLLLSLAGLIAVGCDKELPVSPSVSAVLVSDDRPPRLLSAFFGLDNELPFVANRLWVGAAGQDGMPVVMSHTLDAETLQPEDFQVIMHSGASATPLCVTLRPAQDVGENRTVLLIGEFGDADDDPPATVVVAGDLLSDIRADEPLNFRGTEISVIPLDSGPTLIWAEIVPREIWSRSGTGTVCPSETEQVIRVVWTGGVKLPTGQEPGDRERDLYRVTLTHADGSNEEISPAALAELGDNDNNHHLCLNTNAPAAQVFFPGGHLVDPNKDLNPDTQIEVIDAASDHSRIDDGEVDEADFSGPPSRI